MVARIWKRELASVVVIAMVISQARIARADDAIHPPSKPQDATTETPNDDAFWQRYWGMSLGALLALPYGREGARWGEATPGFTFGGRLGFTPVPLTLGFDFEYLSGGSDKFEADVWSERADRDVSSVVTRSVSMMKLDVSLRLQPYWHWLPVRPYIELVAGVQFTSTDYKATLGEEDVQWSDNYHATGALAWGIGVDVLLSQHLGVTFGVRRYYGPNAVTSHELLVDDVNARVQYGKPTQLTTFMFGLVGSSNGL